MRYAIGTVLLAFFVTSLAFAQEAQGPGVEITVYNQNVGLVKDRRLINLRTDGVNTVRFDDVAAQIDATSVHFKSLSFPENTQIMEQNYQFDLTDTARLMSKYLDKDVVIVRYNQNGEVVERTTGRLLSAAGGRPAVIDVNGRLILDPPGVVELPALPEGLISKPTLDWMIWTNKPGEHLTEVSYLTDGLNWRADYVAAINAEDTALDWNGWVTLTNTSGAAYKNAKLKLVAGTIHRVEEVPRALPGMARAAMAEGAEGFREEAFFEYHLYTLERPTDIRDNETKQVSLLSASGVKAKKLFIYDPEGGRWWWYGGGDRSKAVNVILEIVNSADQGLGMPLPKGKVRVYKADSEGSLQFIGEDLIEHTPKDEKIRLYVGDAFDVVGERTVTRQEEIAPDVYERDVTVSIRNHKDTPITVTAVEHLWGTWTVTRKSHEFTQKDAYTIEFPVEVPADGETKVTYTARIKT